MLLEVDRRMLSPCMARNDFWWMGLDPEQNRTLNNWNPWINSNWLASTLRLDRVGNQVEVTDSYSLKRAAAQVTQTLMTPHKVAQTAAGELAVAGDTFPSGRIKLFYDARAFSFSQEEIRIEDAR